MTPPMGEAEPGQPEGLVAERDYAAEARLPDGVRCDDCGHARRCFGLGFSQSGNTSCDFSPSRFRALAAQQGAA